MSNIVNLKNVRKAKARHEKDVIAEANRAKHGISKSAHKRAQVMAERDAQKLESHHLDED